MNHHSYLASKRHLVRILVGPALAVGLSFVAACGSSSGGGGGTALSHGSGGMGGMNMGSGGYSAGGSGASHAGASNAGGRNAVAPVLLRLKEIDLVSDRRGAAYQDPNLINSWGLAINPAAQNGPIFWVADNGTGVATLYDANGKPQPLIVTVPPAPGQQGPSAPTGQVFNDDPASFMGDKFIFASEDGVISGWQAGTTAIVRSDQSQSKAIYKGIAIIHSNPDGGGTAMLVATNFHAGAVDVFDANYNRMAIPNAFVDPQMPKGFAPFNVAWLNGKVYVSYAKQDDKQEDDVAGPGNGRVDVFEPDGTFVKTVISGGALNSPWGMAVASSPQLGIALLVGNFGDGRIHAYDVQTGALIVTMADAFGKPLKIDGLWALEFGPKTDAADLSQTLYFTAGPDDEKHGLFGRLELAP